MKLLEQVRNCLRMKRYAYRTEQCYVRWICQYIHFHKDANGFRHPTTLGAAGKISRQSQLAVSRGENQSAVAVGSEQGRKSVGSRSWQ